MAWKLTLDTHEFGDSSRDPEDGSTYSVGDKLILMERNPSDPTSPTVIQIEVTKVYETDGANILTVDDATGCDPTTKDWVVLFETWATVTSAQQTKGTWQADKTTELLGSSDRAQRYG